MSSKSGSNVTQLDDLKARVRARLEQQVAQSEKTDTSSREYHTFVRENMPAVSSRYEKAALWCGSFLSVDPGKDASRIQKDLSTSHLSCSPADVVSLSFLGPIGVFFVVFFFTTILPFVFTGGLSLYYLIFSLILAGFAYVPLSNMPAFLAQKHRQAASNQMVLAVFYIVTFMRHTPNFERAIEFAADHIGAPLAFDLKKVLWDVETEDYYTVSESLEAYLVQWRDSNREFIEAMNLIQSSLFESDNARRVTSLDKALDVILEETYEKMLHYAQDLKGPVTMLHMLGIILPVLGLVILPLAVSFFDTHWTFIASLYNVLIPLVVFYLSKRILTTRPTGYGSSDNVSALQRSYVKSGATTPVAVLILFVMFGFSPLIMHAINPSFDIAIGDNFSLLGYKSVNGEPVGPFGLGAGLLSLFITLGLGLGGGLYYFSKAKDAIKLRKKTKELELEFAAALFQLGNRIGDGIPTELAFGKVAQSSEGTQAGTFFYAVANNVQRLGLGVEDAIFSQQHGVIRNYPSNLIESSMKVLVESSKKGPLEASKALMSMSNYIKEMHRVDERLKDLLSDVLSSMKSQINFLLPTIAGIVIGITSMITTVLGAVSAQAENLGGDLGGQASALSSFGLGIPTFYFQFVIGVYVVQVVLTLAYLVNGIENGVDPLAEDFIRGKSLLTATSLYVGIAFVVILIFNLIAGQIIGATA